MNFPKMEEELVEHWKKTNMFERSVNERPLDKLYSIYDGPPFATGLPHYGHVVPQTMKDIIPRYATMKGYRVERRWGWDCHGLPVENLIEKELGLKTKQDIEALGVAKFNAACRASVQRYTTEWRTTIDRLGRWVDMDNDYRTMDPSFMESVWWVFKQLWDKDLIYEGKKAMHVCPRCVTPLSNFEVTLGYKDVVDTAVTWKFPVVGQPNTYLLAWTTTPWSTLSTMGLSVGPDYTYIKAKVGDDYYILVKDRVETILAGLEYSVVETFLGKDLVGWEYQPIVDYFKTLSEVGGNKNVYHVFAGDYVEVTEGTGIVTINGSYGEIDMQAAQRNGLPLVLDVAMDGNYNAIAGAYAGLPVKVAEPQIINDMQQVGLVFKAEPYTHSYPHCWRCDTALLNYATNCWFVKVTQLKDQMIKNNEQINWVPTSMKHGRFGKWLEGAKDWAISRDRYWGTPLPVWKSADGDVLCIGSIAELKKLSGVEVTDLHKESVDTIIVQHNGKEYKRISSVLDCWFESGSMPYAQQHYPFENQAVFDQSFPANFIAEGQDQTRGWFYTLNVLATALFDKPAFTNVVVNGLVLAEDGKKMSKRLKNYPEPSVVLNKYGADALRFYLMNSQVVHAEDIRFSEKGVDLVLKKLIMILWNTYTFYSLFAEQSASTQGQIDQPMAVMDQWVLALLNETVTEVSQAMEQYDFVRATTALQNLVQDISTWYIRRSRDRFKVGDAEALATLRTVLLTTVKLLAPFTPFVTERIYLDMHGSCDSVHLERWPEVNPALLKPELLKQMTTVRVAVEQILALREQASLKVRQPLTSATVPGSATWPAELVAVLAAEVNVQAVLDGPSLAVDTVITPELAQQGMLRELVRAINALRKQQKLTIQDRIAITYQTDDAVVQSVFTDLAEELKAGVLANELSVGTASETLTVNGITVQVTLTKL